MADTNLSAGLVIDGNLSSEGSIRIDGRVRGRVVSKTSVELGPTGAVTSDVEAKRVVVAGSVDGNVTGTERVDLLTGAKLTGDVRAQRLTIADGASFRGKVDMEVGGDDD